jgi:hypothetical protein
MNGFEFFRLPHAACASDLPPSPWTAEARNARMRKPQSSANSSSSHQFNIKVISL